MTNGTAAYVGRLVGQVFHSAALVGLSDSELLERFAQRGPHSANDAFALLLARHGALVLGVCRDVLGNEHRAEDAFQATFLVLARRASWLRVRGSADLGPWLYGVAYRTASKSRQADARRHAREARSAKVEPGLPPSEVEDREVRAQVHVEVDRLPQALRQPVVLCYFEGRTHDEAAAALGWPVGTVRSRLSRARNVLRTRLERRGIAPGACIAGSLWAQPARFVAPARLIEATLAAIAAAELGAATSVKLMAQALVRLRRPVGAAALVTVLIGSGLGLSLRGAPPIPGQAAGDPTPPREEAVRPASRANEPAVRARDPVRLGGARFHHGGSQIKVIYAPDGNSLVTTDLPEVIRVWDVRSGRAVRTIGGEGSRFCDIAVAPDGKALASIDEAGNLRTWELETGRPLRR
jgi:RNA polymerase sigma factor (sigma-70 family)